MSETVVIVQGDGTVAVSTPVTTVVEVQAAGPAGPAGPLGPFLGHIWIPGLPDPGEEVYAFIANETLTVAANLAGWLVTSQTAATGSTVAQILRNGVEIGTLTWSASGTTAALATTSGTAKTLATTDFVSIVFPTPADATLADITIRVYATRA
jgi:hypothetical protein